MRWLLIAITCAGCPAIEPAPDPGELPDPSTGEPLPPSNCARGTAPPITYCREKREGYSVSSASQSSEGALFISDWTHVTNGGAGHSQTIWGDGFPIEAHHTGTFAGQMTTLCSEQGRVSIEHAYNAATRVYYDTANRRRSSERDEELDGVFEDRDLYTYNDAGLLIRDDHDRGPGTPIDRVFAFDYDDRGRMLSATTDRGGDGDIDAVLLNTWDEQDRETVQEQYEHGELVARWIWTYDGQRELAIEHEGVYRWTNSHDDRDRVVGVEFLDLATDTVESVMTHRYDDLDRMIETVEDHGVDGTVDERITWEYCR